jgi:cyanophycin synthetase
VRLVDTRRLTGWSVWPQRPALIRAPGVAAELARSDVDVDAATAVDVDVDAALAAIECELDAVFRAFGLPRGPLRVRRHQTGVSLALDAARDALDGAADAVELAIVRALARQSGAPVLPLDDEPQAAVVRALLVAERNAPLLALEAAAAAGDVPFFVDDTGVTLGQGARGRTWPLPPPWLRPDPTAPVPHVQPAPADVAAARCAAVPAPDAVPWEQLGRIPIALVTGTNGKTTTTRLLAAILAKTGRVVAHTSTDGVVVDGVVVDAGDWSGPGGARRALRDPRVEVAVLETARGGLLRRGLAVSDYAVGVVTNVSDDHLGEYGVDDVDDMADVKALVGRGAAGAVVVNGHDPRLLARVPTFRAPVILFGTAPCVAVDAHVAAGGRAVVVDAGALWRLGGASARVQIARARDIPFAFAGKAPHNLENAAAAAAAAWALDVDDAAIAAGLAAVVPTARDTPGRCQVLEHDGVRLVLDFAHNPAAIAATLRFLHALRSDDATRGRLVVVTGAAGDRTDAELRAAARAIYDGGVDAVIVRELPKYLRGRLPGAIPAIFRAELVRCGLADSAIADAADDVDAVARALDDARAGDTVALLVQVDAPGVTSLLTARGWSVG